jgi:hypothetical protein
MDITMLFIQTIIFTSAIFLSPNVYDGISIVNVQIENPTQLLLLREGGARSLACFDQAGETPMLLDEASIKQIKKLGIKFNIIETNIDERIRRFDQLREEARNNRLGGWYSDYKTWGEVNTKLQALEDSAPDIATTFIVGQTHEGRDIHGIRISAPGSTEGRKQVLFNGCQHAREWIAVMVPTYAAEHLVEGWSNDPEVQAYLETTEVIIVPIVNPDGYEFTYAPSGDRYWRKNRRNNSGSCEGVDLNRNWDYDWNGGDSTSTNTCSDIYVGPNVFSEPETQAMRDLINTLPNLVSHVDFHSYSQLILEPWASSNNPPPRVNIVKALSSSMSEAIAGVHGETYVAGTGGDLLYLADGVFPDWTTNGGSLSYTIELRPTGSPGFELPPGEIIPTCEESYAAVKAMLQFVNQPLTFSFPNGVPQFADQGSIVEFPMHIESIFDEPIDTNTTTLHVRFGNTGTFATRHISQNQDDSFTVELPTSFCDLEGEYWFSVTTQDGLTVRYPAGEEVLRVSIAATARQWNMDQNPNWTMEGQWGWGVPTGGGGSYGNPDPTSGATGNNVLGYNLNGDYQNNLSETYLTTETVDLSDRTNTQLQFKRYLNVEQPVYDHASVSVRAGNGSWSTVWSNQSTIEDDQWQTVAYDISSVADAQPDVQIRWTMGTTDSAWTYSGWNIDDIEILSSGGAGVVGDINCDGIINVTDILLVVGGWGPCNDHCAEDIIPDGTINVLDLLHVIGNW